MRFTIPRKALPLIVLLVVLIIVEIIVPKPIDWTRSFNYNDKRPYGSKILYELLKTDIFPNNDIKINELPIFNYLEDKKSSKLQNLLIINDKFSIPKWEVKRLINWVKRGNNILIATNHISKSLKDTLCAEIKYSYTSNDKTTLNFTNKKLRTAKGYNITKAFDKKIIDTLKNSNLIILGTNKRKDIQLAKIPFGKGEIIISSQPLLFTNYNILKNNTANYIAGVFSYMPDYDLVWDSYYKPNKNHRSGNPLVFIMTYPALRLAYFLLLFGLIAILIFQGKRTQRAIPIIKPLPNTSLNFINTLARLYYVRKNHRDIAFKQIKFLRGFIKRKYYIDFNTEKLKELAIRTSINTETLQLLLNTITQIENAEEINTKQLIDINKKIEYFYKNCK